MKPPCTRFVWKFTKFDIEDEDPSDNYKPDPMNEHHCEWDSLEGFGFDNKHTILISEGSNRCLVKDHFP